MILLGISGGVQPGNQDGSAALLVDGRLVAAGQEERFSGVKFANGQLPRRAAADCLAQWGLSIRDVDAVVFPGATYTGFVELLERFFQFQFGHAPRVQLVDHHTAHAASTYYASGWDEALIVTMDFSGDRRATTVRVGRAGRLETPLEIFKPDSLGVFYAAITQLLGFQKDSDEYKVMGLAAYGQPRYDLSHILQITAEGYHLQSEFLRGVSGTQPAASPQERLFDRFPVEVAPRTPGGPLEPAHFDLAASAQAQLEEAVLQLVRFHIRRTGVSRVCLAGGVALNCKMNQRLREDPAVSQLYVPPVVSDAGLSLGAAYLVALEHGEAPAALPHAYWGPEFSSAAIRQVLDRAGLEYQETDDPAGAAAQRLAEGRILGWFQGRMEFGPRALGNRSILANPADPSVKDTINQRIKFREEFRPLAPALLPSRGPELFAGYCDSPYMTQTFSAGPAAQRQIPGGVHADGTSRLQSVHAETNPLFAELLERFEKQAGIPALVNTSLNAYNDPIACSPAQALRTYFATGLDALILGSFVLDKPRPCRA